MKKAIVIGITLGALLALAAPAYAEGPPPLTRAEVCPILPVSDVAYVRNQAGFQVVSLDEPYEYYLCQGVFVTVPLIATNQDGRGVLLGLHASPPWPTELHWWPGDGYTPIWAGEEDEDDE